MSRELPFISIIVPTYARPERLSACLQALACLEYPGDRYEVIVVDDGSDNPQESVVSTFRDRLDIRLLRQPHAGPAAARNRGSSLARGVFLAFTDDDCMPVSSWLKTLATRLIEMPDCMVGGLTLNALTENSYSTASQLLVDYLYSYYNEDTNQGRFFTSNNFALSADSFLKVGGFDISFPGAAGEDREFCDRWLEKGYRMIHAPEALVYHAHTLTLPTFWQQHFNYGRGAFRFHQARLNKRGGRIKVEPLSFYLNLLRYPFSREQGTNALLLAILLLVSQLANVAGFFREFLNHKDTKDIKKN
jgi:GT2 family glycosyltransferase